MESMEGIKTCITVTCVARVGGGGTRMGKGGGGSLSRLGV